MPQKKKAYKTLNLHLKHIVLPAESRFKEQISTVISEITSRLKLQNKLQQRMQKAHKFAARSIIEGLYQVFGGRYPQGRLAVPRSDGAYGKNNHQLEEFSHTAVMRVLDAVQSLGWIEISIGFKNRDGENIVSTLTAAGELLNVFQNLKFVWRKMSPQRQDVIVLKSFDPKTKTKIQCKFTDNKDIRGWRKNLLTYNKFISSHAICLSIENHNLEKLVKRMANEKYQLNWPFGDNKKKPRILNYLHVQLRRIFSRGSFELGGRFYGGWWQFIPSEYRPFITINGLPTVELDYSEIHPRIMYQEANLSPPDGDLYDIGIRFDGISYNKDREPYKSKRKVIKTFINAMINDDRGNYKLSSDQIETIGMNTAQLEAAVLKKHPIIKNIKGKGHGLRYQFIDSQIAEKVMMKLLSKDILCLPVHDSFICQEHHLSDLENAMNEAYVEVLGSIPELKAPETFQTDFEPVFYPNGVLDLTYMKNMYKDSQHDAFLSTYDQSKAL
jgi:hypothetical protein